MIAPIEHNGQRYYINCHDGDWISNALLSTGKFYEYQWLSMLSPDSIRGTAILDIGANIGNHSIFFTHVLGANVIAFEPMKENLARLEANAMAHGFAVINAIVGDGGKYGIAEVTNGNYGATKYDINDQGRASLKIDSMGINNISLIKIDVEGMELSVLNGAKETITSNRCIVVFECTDEDKYKEIEQYFSDISYDVAVLIKMNDKPSMYIATPKKTD
jgi:protein O-GlcNAc transferase